MKERLYEQEEGRRWKVERRRKGGEAQPLAEDAHRVQYTPDVQIYVTAHARLRHAGSSL